ncbi:MAG: hypothetical protein IKP47_06540 [Ruminococcus sp.]|nr:hypothetical protein [Ruminococcus sp.]
MTIYEIRTAFSDDFGKLLAAQLKERGFEPVCKAEDCIKLSAANKGLNGVIFIRPDIRMTALSAAAIYRDIDPYFFIVNDVNDAAPSGDGEDTVKLDIEPDVDTITDIISDISAIRLDTAARNADIRLEKRICERLLSGCITPDLPGYHYLCDAIFYCVKQNSGQLLAKEEVYDYIAEKRGISKNSIDHCIRNSIFRGMSQCTHEFILDNFGLIGVCRNTLPSPKEYIHTISENIKRNIKEEMIK